MELLVAFSITSVLFLAVGSIIVTSTGAISQQIRRVSLLQHYLNLLRCVNDPVVLDYLRAPMDQCLISGETGGSCAPILAGRTRSTRLQRSFDLAGTATLVDCPGYDTSDLNQGLSTHGQICESSSGTCPLRYNLQHHFGCATDHCSVYFLEVEGELLTLDPSMLHLPVGPYRIHQRFYYSTARRDEILLHHTTNPSEGGGRCQPGQWKARPLSQVQMDTGNNIVGQQNNGELTVLRPGHYVCRGRSVVWRNSPTLHQARLAIQVNATSGTTEYFMGTSSQSFLSQTPSWVMGSFSIPGPDTGTLALEHICESTVSDSDFGGVTHPGNSQLPNIFATLHCLRTR